MLPNSHQSTYNDFRRRLQAIQTELDKRTLKATVGELQKIVQGELKSLNLEEIDPALQSRVRSLEVEIDKQLRLLNIDVTFLQTAKQPETVQNRLNQVRARVETLIHYCNILLGEDSRDQ